MDEARLKEALKLHKLFINGIGNCPANLRESDLRRIDLRESDLRESDLRWADLRGADLRWADLRRADIRWADIRGAKIQGADLRETDLRKADLRWTDLRWTDLRETDLRETDLRRADLQGIDFYNAKGLTSTCPKSGQFTAWKKINKCIIKLTVPWFSRRVSAYVSRKCRVELAFIEKIYDENNTEIDSVSGSWDKTFIYKSGKYVSPKNGYDASREIECAPGIHCFINRDEAEEF